MQSYTLSNWDGSIRKPRENLANTASSTGSAVAETSVRLPLPTRVPNGRIHENPFDEGQSERSGTGVQTALDALNDAESTSTARLTGLRSPSTPGHAKSNIMNRADASSSPRNGWVGQNQSLGGEYDLVVSPQYSETISADSLFDEDVGVTFASPISKRTESRHGRALGLWDRIPPSLKKPGRRNATSMHASESSEVVSVYSADAEGEVEDDEVEVIDLTRNSSPRTQIDQRLRLPFSPPPLGPSDSLFTPPSEKRPRKRKRKQVLDFVAVPPLKKGKHSKNYRPISSLIPPPLPSRRAFSPLPPKPKCTREKSPQSGIRVHRDIAFALDSAFQGDAPPALPDKKPKTSKPGIRAHQDITSALSSAFQDHSTPTRSQKKPKTSKSSVNIHRDITSALSSVFQGNDSNHASSSSQMRPPQPPLPQRPPKRRKPEDPEFRPAKKSRPGPLRRPLTEITPLPPPPPPPPPPVPPSYAYDSENDSLQIFSAFPDIPTDGLDLWFNTRHLLPDPMDIDAVSAIGKSGERTFGSGTSRPWITWPKSTRPAPEDSDAEYSVGGWESDDDFDDDLPDEVEQQQRNEIDFASEVPFTGTPNPLPPTTIRSSETSPPRVDLKQIMLQRSSAKKPRHDDDVPPVADPQTHQRNSPAGDMAVTPSQKALGKRRAEPIVEEDITISPYQASVNYAVNAFVNASPLSYASYTGPSTRPPPTIFRNPQASAILFSSISSTPYYENDLPGSAMPLEDDMSEAHSPFLTNHAPSLEPYLDDVTSSYSMATMEPWNEVQSAYAFDTINPTLLQQPDEFVVDTSYDALSVPGGFENKTQWNMSAPNFQGPDQDGYYHGPSTPGRSTTPSGFSSPLSPLPDDRQTAPASQKVVTATSRTDNSGDKARNAPADEFNLGEMPVYKSDSNDQDWNGTDVVSPGKRRRKKTKRLEQAVAFELRQSDDDDGDDEEPTSTITNRKMGPPTTAQVKIGPPIPRGRFDWELGSVEKYCHQCRTKSFKLKMACPVCAKEWCNRCIANRYPEIEFLLSFQVTHPCPCCTNSCNCDICCKKRGDIFISSARAPKAPRGPAPARSALSTRAKGKQKAKDNQPQQKSNLIQKPPRLLQDVALHQAVISSASEWGPIYGFDGRKVVPVEATASGSGGEGGAGYADDNGVGVGQATPKVQQEDHQRKRTFVGAWHPSWSHPLSHRKPIIIDLDLDPESLGPLDLNGGTNPTKEQRKKKTGGKRSRMYVGKEAMLNLPLVQVSIFLEGEEDAEGESDSEVDAEGEEEGEEVLGAVVGDAGMTGDGVGNNLNNGMEGGLGHIFSSPLSSIGDESEGDEVWALGGAVITGVAMDGDGSAAASTGDEDAAHKRFSPEDVGDNDLARAIALSLSAWGLSVTPGPPSATSDSQSSSGFNLQLP